MVPIGYITCTDLMMFAVGMGQPGLPIPTAISKVLFHILITLSDYLFRVMKMVYDRVDLSDGRA